jgi:hypothetical protein
MYAKHNIRGELQLTVYCATEKQTELSVQNSSEIISPMYGNGEAVVVIMLHQNPMHHIEKRTDLPRSLCFTKTSTHRPPRKKVARKFTKNVPALSTRSQDAAKHQHGELDLDSTRPVHKCTSAC